MSRVAWYHGTETEPILNRFRDWLENHVSSRRTAISYVANVATALKHGVKEEDEIWNIDLAEGSLSAIVTAWKKYQLFLALDGDGQVKPAYTEEVQNLADFFLNFTAERHETLARRTLVRYRSIVLRLVSKYKTGSVEEWRRSIDTLPKADRVQIHAVWKLLTPWYKAASQGQTVADPWCWNWTEETAKAFLAFLQNPMTPATRVDLMWKHLHFESGEAVPALALFGPSQPVGGKPQEEPHYSFTCPGNEAIRGKVNFSAYHVWLEAVDPTGSPMEYVFPEFPGSKYPASAAMIEKMTTDAQAVLKEVEKKKKQKEQAMRRSETFVGNPMQAFAQMLPGNIRLIKDEVSREITADFSDMDDE